METIEIVETTAYNRDGMVVIDRRGAVWYTLDKPWWHPVSWFRSLAMPGRRAFIQLATRAGKIRVRAVNISSTHIRMGQSR
jgi:hypothetical protein